MSRSLNNPTSDVREEARQLCDRTAVWMKRADDEYHRLFLAAALAEGQPGGRTAALALVAWADRFEAGLAAAAQQYERLVGLLADEADRRVLAGYAAELRALVALCRARLSLVRRT